jgi:PHS family inorganic phosphate transporter-like MFS transporter
MLIIFATILTISVPAKIGGDDVLVWLSVFRIVLGIGVGGDYPMSASVIGDRASLRKRGTMLALIFSNQGWGSFVGSLVTMAVLACYKHVMDVKGDTNKVDGGMFISYQAALRLAHAFRSVENRSQRFPHPSLRHALPATYSPGIKTLYRKQEID